MMVIYGLAFHAGFGSSGTILTDRPVEMCRALRSRYGRLDRLDAYSCYTTDTVPQYMNEVRSGSKTTNGTVLL